MTTITRAERQSRLAEIEAFERRYDYDSTYMKAMLEHAPESLQVFSQFAPMAGHRLHAPIEVYFTAKIVAFQFADCGPCLQLAVRFAREAGVPKELLETILRKPNDLPADLQQVRQFATATLENGANLDSLRDDLETIHGKAAVIELGLVIAAAQVFPVVKRALGYYKSCSLVSVEV